MKFKKALKLSLAVALVFGSVSTLVGCNKDDDTVQKTEEEKIYDLYVSYMSAQGETPLTYEEWYATIKGAKGEKGDKGDKGEKGDKGDVGASGKNGATWHYGTASTPSVNLGVVGDFYFNTSTQAIYIKDASGWGTPIVIEDGQDAVAPQIRINSNSKKWEVSIDGGISWETTTVVAEGKNGEKGTGIVSISKTNTIDNVDTYTITYSDGNFTTFSVVNGLDGKDGKDGATWLTGEGVPTLQENLEAKEGDFYFDSVDSAIYLFNGKTWVLQVDLVENKQEETLTLEAGVYEGNLAGFPFSIEIAESDGDVYIESLTVEGLPEGTIKEDSYSLVVNDSNEIVLTLEVASGENQYRQITRYFRVAENNKLELSVSQDEMDLLKGIYAGYLGNQYLTLSDNIAVFKLNDKNVRGSWSAVDGDRENGEYQVKVVTDDDCVYVLYLNYIERSYNVFGVEELDNNSIYSQTKANIEFIEENYYAKPLGSVDSEQAALNFYTEIGDYFGAEPTTLTLNGRKYAADKEYSFSVDNNNHIVLPAWKVENDKLYISSLLLNTYALINQGNIYGEVYYEIAEKTYVHSYNVHLDVTPSTIIDSSIEQGGNATLGQYEGVYLYNSHTYTDYIKINLGKNIDEDVIAFTVKECRDNFKEYTPSYGYTDLTRDGEGNYYFIFYPYYYMQSEPKNAEYTYTYTFVLSDGSYATYVINTVFSVNQ